MTALTLEGHVGTQIEIDLCAACHLLWFDRYESPKLAPAGVLKLFQIIGQEKQRPAASPAEMRCPRCDLRLLRTHDRQRNTPFEYWRCAREHGRLITFFDFLREKDFIRPLSAAQVDELRRNVQSVNCSNCGAPVDLAQTSACAHCGTPLSMIDVAQVQRMVDSLREASQKPAAIDPMLPVRLEQEKREVERLFESMRTGNRPNPSSLNLLEVSLGMIASWLK